MSGSIDVVGTSLSVTGDVAVPGGVAITGTVDVSGSSVTVAGTQSAVSLNAVTGNGAGSTVDWGTTKSTHTMIVSWTGSPSALDVVLEGSHDGVIWAQLVEVPNASSNPIFKAVAANCRYTRARMLTHTGSLVLTATVAAS